LRYKRKTEGDFVGERRETETEDNTKKGRKTTG
jgi:hypothetical protein